MANMIWYQGKYIDADAPANKGNKVLQNLAQQQNTKNILSGKTTAATIKADANKSSGDQLKDSYSSKELADMKARPGAYTQAEKDSMNAFMDKQNAAKTTNPDGSPIRPDLKAATNAKGQLNPAYSVSDKLKSIGDIQSIVPQIDQRLAGINQDTSGLDALKTEALRTGPSAWLSGELARNEAQTGYQLGDINSAGMNAAAQARAQLASKNGLSSGASERLAGNANKDILAQQQNLRRTTNLGNMALSSQDQMNKMQAISQLTPAQQSAAQFQLTKAGIPIQQLASEQGMNNARQTGNVNTANAGTQYDISNALQDLANQNNFNSSVYNQQMQAWGAGQTANAMQNAANAPNPGLLGMGGFLGTGIGSQNGILGTGIAGNSTGGKLTGAAGGALIGSAIMPGVGTLAGAGIGGLLSGGGGGGGTVICTHYYRKGLIDKATYRACQRYGANQVKEFFDAYMKWATPFVAFLNLVPLLSILLWPWFKIWIKQMAFEEGHGSRPWGGDFVLNKVMRPFTHGMKRIFRFLKKENMSWIH